MKNLLILLGILLSSPFVVAQHLAINGNVAIADNSPEGTRVVVTKNGNKLDEQVLNKKGHFDLKLAFDADYKISFEKTGYITKIVSINTEVPEESIENIRSAYCHTDLSGRTGRFYVRQIVFR